MKKYIAPNIKFINIASEGALLADSQTMGFDGSNPQDGMDIQSNHRTSIWGNEE